MVDLVFDTETTGFWNKHLASDDPKQPWVVQLGAILTGGTKIYGRLSVLIKQEGVVITEGAFKTHGITEAEMNRYGVDSFRTCATFQQMVRQADRVVAHNLPFDVQMVERQFAAHNSKPDWPKLQVCTMRSAARLVSEKNGEPYSKWPNLEKAFKTLVDPSGFEGVHDALSDAEACLAVLRVLEDEGEELTGEIHYANA